MYIPEIEILLPDLLQSIWELGWTVLLLILFGSITGGLLTASTGTVYETRASMLVTARTADGNYPNGIHTWQRGYLSGSKSGCHSGASVHQ